MSQATVTRVLDTLHVLEVPIPFPMKTVTVVVDTAQPVTLVDAGLYTPEARTALEEGLAQLGLKLSEVERVIVTHHHPDHYGMAGVLEELGAEIYMLGSEWERGGLYWRDWENWLPKQLEGMHENGLPRDLHDSQEQFHRFLRGLVRPAQNVKLLREGQTVTLAGREWEVLCLNGHADGHLSLWLPEEGLLLAADAILPKITPNIGLWIYSRPNPLADYFGTLGQIAALGAARAIVGHHGPLMTEVTARAESLKHHHHERLDFLLGVVRQQPDHAYALARRMFTRPLNEANLRFALAETLAHLEYLRLEGQLGRESRDGVLIYHSGG